MATKKTTPDTGTSAAAADATKAPAASVPGDKPVDDAAKPQQGQEVTRPDDAGAAPDAGAVPDTAQAVQAVQADQVQPAIPESDKPLDEPAPQPDPDAKRLYIVTALSIRHDGRVYGVGKDITLTDAQAKRLAGLVVLAPVTSKE